MTLMLSLLGMANEAWAANRTIKVVPVTGCQVRIKVGTAAWTSYSSSTITKTVADNTSVKVEAQMSSGYNWTGWTGTYTSANNPYTFTVSKNATLTASVNDTWSETLIAGATYTVTTVSGNTFKVTCNNTSSPNHNKSFNYIGYLDTSTSASGTITVNFNNTSTIRVKQYIRVQSANATLKLQNGNNPIVTLKKHGRDGNFIYSSAGKLQILGNSSKGAPFIIDGGAVFPTAGDARSLYVEAADGFTNHGGNGVLIYATGGALVMKNTILQNNYHFGGASGIESYNTADTYPEFNLEDVTIQGCWAQHGSGIYIVGADQHGTQADGAILKNVTIQKCYATGTPTSDDPGGGTIRTNGGGRTRLTIDGGEICDNRSGNPSTGGYGGGIYWNACGKPETRITLKNNVKIHHNDALPPNAVATTKSWAGGIMIESRMTIESAEIYNNGAKLGGGIYMCSYGGSAAEFDGKGFDLTVSEGVKIYNNYATEIGGGAYLAINKSPDLGYAPDGTAVDAVFKFTLDGGEVRGNHAPLGGGVAIMDKAPKKVKYCKWRVDHTSATTVQTLVTSGEYKPQIKISSGSIHDNYTDGGDNYGAGIYVRKYIDDEVLNGTTLMSGSNTISTGFKYADVGGAGTVEFTATGGLIYGNGVNNGTVKTAKGGAFYITDEMGNVSPYYSQCNVSISKTNTSSVSIYQNKSTTSGGAIFVNNGKFEMDGGTIGGSTAYANETTAGNGGGFYITGASSIVDISGGEISYNKASGDGGGFYVNESSATGTTIEGTALVQHNEATNGAGAFIKNGELDIKGTGVEISYNKASADGGGLYANGGNTNITKGIIEYNEAAQGGAIYANGGTVDVNYVNTTDGSIRYNYASLYGGGLYISADGRLNLKGKTTLTKNHVPQGNAGGGVYLLGTVQAGASATDVITVADNFADDTNDPESYTPTAFTRNNIYLPNPVDTETKDVITIVTNGLDLSQTRKIGFSVPGNFLPVIYCADNNYLNNNQTAIIAAVFEDSERFTARYFPSHPTYKNTYIYLVADTWIQAVTSQPSGFNINNIDSEEDLAWLISLVNGLNGVTGSDIQDFSGQTIKVTKDLNMSANAWVPIGRSNYASAKAFKGTFDGGGHVIKGISCSYLGESGSGTGATLGLFGNVDGAVIHDVFLEDAIISVTDGTSTQTFNLGGLAASGSATIYNCTSNATINSNNTHTTIGGLIGTMSGGTIHSSAAMSAMTGYTMGGIVGKLTSGSLYNSFANPKFSYYGTGSDFVGGLVAENSGTIQNCYVRFSRTSSLGSALFGQIVGKTNNNNITICYHPTHYASGISANLVAPNYGTVSSLEYGDVVAPYLYNHSNDNTLVSDNTKNLLDELNRWVTGHSGYAPWKRTTAGSYSTGAGNINGDYPIHEHTDYTCAASHDGVSLDYAKSLDIMLTRHTTDATINLYKNDETSKATGNNVIVYIDEDVSLLQTDDTKDIAAYTCQTLKSYTRGERWHYFSSSLSNSGIGFNYGTMAQVPFSWAENPCNVTFSTADDQALFPSDMPHINKVDLYCFYEPEYHWLNLKRNTASHWHMNAPTVPIAYIGNGTGGDGNETSLVPGKGYLVSIDQEQLVQNRGTLNNGDVTLHDVTKTDFNAWAGLLGYNLLGNPYQSYLDIEKFMAENNTALWGGAKDEASVHTYAVYDPETDCYLQYKRGVSRGARATTGLLNPHQGFLIRKTTTDSGTNTQVKFTNAMRSNDGTPSFREPQPAYPLVNVILTDSQGRNDLVVLELGRDADEGVEKLRVGECSGRIGLALGSESYAILFRDETAEQQALRFEAEEEGEFTLRWETANAQFESLTLVDNIEGSTTDMLSRDSYSFEGNPDQYASRFRIVIGEYKGIDEPEVPEPVEGPTCSFAYQTGDQLVVEGEGTLEVVDMLGHVVMTERLSDGQSRVRVPQTAGVYLLRLTGKNGTRTQKIVTK